MKVAVYGSLRYGASNNRLMRGCRRLGLDRIRGTLFSLGAFPGVKLTKPEDTALPSYVTVDVYEAPEELTGEILGRLDRYEGYHPHDPTQSLYLRRRTLTVDGHDCWVYEYKHPVHNDSLVPNGDWLDHGVDNA